jgi:tRNA(Ile)-lysidine synthase
MLKKMVLKIILERRLIESGDRVLVGLSGGPDSVSLLHILHGLRDELGISLSAAHLNHMIRGRDASADEAYVKKLCGKFRIPLAIDRFDVPQFAKQEKLSLEDAARRLRYKFFFEAAKKDKATKIALGHTADDNVETVLMRLVMGTGTRGLLGIPAKRGKIVRPLIECARQEIEDYCGKHKLKPRIDKSNFDTKYLRNRIRHDLIPLLEKINPNARSAIGKAIALLGSDYEYLMGISTKALHGATIKSTDKSIKLDIDKLLMYPDSIRRYVLRAAIENVKGDLENITFTHIYDVLSKLPDDEEWELHLPSGLSVLGDGDVLEITSARPVSRKALSFKYELKVPGSLKIAESGLRLSAEIVKIPKKLKLKDRNQAIIDFSKAGDCLVVRSRRAGDKFSPFGIPGTKKLKDFLIDEKIPSGEKDSVPIVESRGRIAWVAGHRIDNRFKITEKTKKALKLTVNG